MYEAFYGLKEKPFSIQPDPAFLYLGRRHSMAATLLEYGVAHGSGFTVVTGEIGCGKTTLIRYLLDRLEQDVTVGLINNTQSDQDELLRWVLLAFGQPYDAEHPVALFDRFQQFLIDEYGKSHRVVLIIDEAQNLSPLRLEELRMLSNINADKHQLLQLVLVGQPQLKFLLQQPELEQFLQRVAADFHIPRLEAADVVAYVEHRLKVAGRNRALFSKDALLRIAMVTHGVPRTVNLLCDMALVYGFSAQAETIGREIVDEVLADRRRYGIASKQGDDSPEPDPPRIQPVDKKVEPLDRETARLLFSVLSDN